MILDLKDAYVQVSVHLQSRKFLPNSVEVRGVSVLCDMLWPLHCSACLHMGHGSCIDDTPFEMDLHGVVPE